MYLYFHGLAFNCLVWSVPDEDDSRKVFETLDNGEELLLITDVRNLCIDFIIQTHRKKLKELHELQALYLGRK